MAKLILTMEQQLEILQANGYFDIQPEQKIVNEAWHNMLDGAIESAESGLDWPDTLPTDMIHAEIPEVEVKEFSDMTLEELANNKKITKKLVKKELEDLGIKMVAKDMVKATRQQLIKEWYDAMHPASVTNDIEVTFKKDIIFKAARAIQVFTLIKECGYEVSHLSPTYEDIVEEKFDRKVTFRIINTDSTTKVKLDIAKKVADVESVAVLHEECKDKETAISFEEFVEEYESEENEMKVKDMKRSLKSAGFNVDGFSKEEIVQAYEAMRVQKLAEKEPIVPFLTEEEAEALKNEEVATTAEAPIIPDEPKSEEAPVASAPDTNVEGVPPTPAQESAPVIPPQEQSVVIPPTQEQEKTATSDSSDSSDEKPAKEWKVKKAETDADVFEYLLWKNRVDDKVYSKAWFSANNMNWYIKQKYIGKPTWKGCEFTEEEEVEVKKYIKKCISLEWVKPVYRKDKEGNKKISGYFIAPKWVAWYYLSKANADVVYKAGDIEYVIDYNMNIRAVKDTGAFVNINDGIWKYMAEKGKFVGTLDRKTGQYTMFEVPIKNETTAPSEEQTAVPPTVPQQ